MMKKIALLLSSLLAFQGMIAMNRGVGPGLSRDAGTQLSSRDAMDWSGPMQPPWFLRTKDTGAQTTPEKRANEWANSRVAILLENGTDESNDGPIILQLGQLLHSAVTPVVTTGRLLYRFFSLRHWNKKPEDVEKSKSLMALIYRSKKRVDELNDFEKITNLKAEDGDEKYPLMKMQKKLIKEQDDKLNVGADVQEIAAQKKKIEETFAAERKERATEKREIAQELDRALRRYADMKAETPEFDFSFYFRNHVEFDMDKWHVYKKPDSDLYVLIPKEYKITREITLTRNPEYKKLSKKFGHLKTASVRISGKDYFIEELATGLKTHNLTSIANNTSALFNSLGYGWRHMFTFRRIKEINVEALQELFITGSNTPEFNSVFDPMLTYMIGYGNKKAKRFVGLPVDGLGKLIRQMAVFSQVIYAVDCNNSSRFIRELNSSYMESLMKENQGLLFIAGAIEEPSLYREISLLPHLVNKEPLPFNVNKFFDELQETITAYYKAMGSLTRQIQDALRSIKGSPADVQLLVERRYKEEIFPPLNRELRKVINFVTPVMDDDMSVAATQIPFLWGVYSKIFLPLLGEGEELVNEQSPLEMNISNLKKVFFEIADASKMTLTNNTNESPLFISLTPSENNFTVIKNVTMDKVSLDKFLKEAIFSTQVFISRTWRIAELTLNGGKYYDVTITHKPYVSGWLFQSEGALGDVSYKVKEGGNTYRWYRTSWDFESNSMVEEEEPAEDVWSKDYDLVAGPYQTWGDSFLWRETWKKSVIEGGAPDIIKGVIKDIKAQRDRA
ncbi:MAG TPA: hypothetical protein QGF02_03855 [Candidatus Babeliales bacterium]|nr:hypothetical protein [Candidatus Babeliales bacterium]